MITKINAEFDTVETAELAVRMIKQKTGGIINIRIESNADFTEHKDNYTPYPIPLNTQSGFLNFIPPFYNASIVSEVNSNSNRIEHSRAAFIEIICEKEAEKVVTQIFTSLGGLKINKK